MRPNSCEGVLQNSGPDTSRGGRAVLSTGAGAAACPTRPRRFCRGDSPPSNKGWAPHRCFPSRRGIRRVSQEERFHRRIRARCSHPAKPQRTGFVVRQPAPAQPVPCQLPLGSSWSRVPARLVRAVASCAAASQRAEEQRCSQPRAPPGPAAPEVQNPLAKGWSWAGLGIPHGAPALRTEQLF